jgi:hypothetical protein
MLYNWYGHARPRHAARAVADGRVLSDVRSRGRFAALRGTAREEGVVMLHVHIPSPLENERPCARVPVLSCPLVTATTCHGSAATSMMVTVILLAGCPTRTAWESCRSTWARALRGCPPNLRCGSCHLVTSDRSTTGEHANGLEMVVCVCESGHQSNVWQRRR